MKYKLVMKGYCWTLSNGKDRFGSMRGKCTHGFVIDGRGCAECDLESYLDALSELERDVRLDVTK